MYRIFAILLLLFRLNPAIADDQVLALLKELKEQVNGLKKQVEQANSRISELENQLQLYRGGQQAAVNPAIGSQQLSAKPVALSNESLSGKGNEKPAVTVGDIKGTFKIPGTETSIGLGGYIKTDVLLNSISSGRDRLGDQQLVLSQIPVGGAPGEHSQLAVHAKESRLWFKSFTPGNWGDINTFIEMDLFGDSATYTYTPRLRHAYGSIGNFLAGQTWTTFLNAAALPDHLDVGGVAGAIASLRQPLLRWTQAFSIAGLSMDWQNALEAPRSRIWDSGLAAANAANPNNDNYFSSPNADRYPDLVTRVNFNPEWGNVSIAALGRQVRYTAGTGLQRGSWGGGVNVAGKINAFGLDNIRFMGHYGNGAGRYVANINTFSDADLDNAGNLELTTTYGGMLAYQHWWNKQWRSTMSYGFSQADQPGFVNTLLNRQVRSLQANMLWSPVNQAMMGIEYTYANRELIDGQVGYLQRIQFSARYSF